MSKTPNYDNEIVQIRCHGCKIYKPTRSMCLECKRRTEQKDDNSSRYILQPCT